MRHILLLDNLICQLVSGVWDPYLGKAYGEREKLHLNYFIWLMTVIYNFIATSILAIPLEKVYGFITYSNVLFVGYKIKLCICWYF